MEQTEGIGQWALSLLVCAGRGDVSTPCSRPYFIPVLPLHSSAEGPQGPAIQHLGYVDLKKIAGLFTRCHVITWCLFGSVATPRSRLRPVVDSAMEPTLFGVILRLPHRKTQLFLCGSHQCARPASNILSVSDPLIRPRSARRGRGQSRFQDVAWVSKAQRQKDAAERSHSLHQTAAGER